MLVIFWKVSKIKTLGCFSLSLQEENNDDSMGWIELRIHNFSILVHIEAVVDIVPVQFCIEATSLHFILDSRRFSLSLDFIHKFFIHQRSDTMDEWSSKFESFITCLRLHQNASQKYPKKTQRNSCGDNSIYASFNENFENYTAIGSWYSNQSTSWELWEWGVLQVCINLSRKYLANIFVKFFHYSLSLVWLIWVHFHSTANANVLNFAIHIFDTKLHCILFVLRSYCSYNLIFISSSFLRAIRRSRLACFWFQFSVFGNFEASGQTSPKQQMNGNPKLSIF